jgi:hypothetical protein
VAPHEPDDAVTGWLTAMHMPFASALTAPRLRLRRQAVATLEVSGMQLYSSEYLTFDAKIFFIHI